MSVGCGSDSSTSALSGEASFNGQPIDRGSIELFPIDGTPGSSVVAPITKGRYEIKDEAGVLASGTYQVRVMALRKTGKKAPARMAGGESMVELEENFIPPIYNTQSTLKIRISDLPNKDDVDFELGKAPVISK